MSNWIEICKAGAWMAKNGKRVTLSNGDLDDIIDSYNPADREAPLVFGHPGDNQPAFGWVDKLKRNGNILLAKFKQVPEAVQKLVNAGHYKKVSISLGADKKSLRHVGLLGAVQPAVPGLKDVKFSDTEQELVIEFSNKDKGEDVEKKELEEKLAAEEKARKEAEKKLKESEEKAEAAEKELSESKQKALEGQIETRIDKLVGKKITAADKPVIKKIALALGDSEEIELSEGAGKKSLDEHLFDFLSGLPDLGLLNEFSAPTSNNDETGVDVSGMMDRV
jgi:predicted HNH restriction endonuclease